MPISQPSATPVTQDEALRAACAEAIEELKAARKLLASQGALLTAQNELLDLENKLSTGLKNLRELDVDEKRELRNALAAAERQITAIRAENDVLKRQRMTFFKKAKFVVIGIVVGVAGCSLFCEE